MDAANRVFPDQSPSKNPILLQDLEKRAREVGLILKGIIPEGVGYAFLMFTFGEDGWMTYASARGLQVVADKEPGSNRAGQHQQRAKRHLPVPHLHPHPRR